MVKKAHITGGIVTNISVAESLAAGDIDGTNAKIGDVWDGSSFTTPDQVIPVPTEVTMRQARLALLEVNLLSTVNTMISSADDATKIEWEYASTVERGNALVATLAAGLSLTDAQLDALFISAGSK